MINARVVNRIGELQNVIAEVGDEGRQQQVMSVASQKAGKVVLRLLKLAAPIGKKEPDFKLPWGQEVSHGRPSIRLGHGTLESKWGDPPDVEQIEGGASFTVVSHAPHMRILLDGAKPHPVPKSPQKDILLTFWRFRHARGQYAPSVDHPGFESKAGFINTALGPFGGRRVIVRWMIDGARQTMSPLRKLFGN